MTLIYAAIAALILVALYTLYRQKSDNRELRQMLVTISADVKSSGQNLEEIGQFIEVKNDSPVYPVAGRSMENVSFFEFFDSREVEKLKEIELRNADIIVHDVFERMGFQNFIGQGIQIVSSIKHVIGIDSEEVVLTFTKEALTRLKAGTAEFVIHKKTDMIIPQLRDVFTGQFLEHGKLAPMFKSSKEVLAQIGANALPGLIAIAHIISNYDINKQLKAIGQNIEFLKNGRMFDQKAELIANFGKLQQVFSLPEPHRSIEMGRIHFDLQKLRNIWAMEAENFLGQIRDDRTKLEKMVKINRANMSDKNTKKMNLVKERLNLMSCSAQLDSIAVNMGRLRVFEDDELQPLERIKSLIYRSYEALPDEKIRNTAQIELDTNLEYLEHDYRLLFPNRNEVSTHPQLEMVESMN